MSSSFTKQEHGARLSNLPSIDDVLCLVSLKDKSSFLIAISGDLVSAIEKHIRPLLEDEGGINYAACGTIIKGSYFILKKK